MGKVGCGRKLIWKGASLWIMEALPTKEATSKTTEFHSHHAVQATFSLGGRFELRTADHRIGTDAAVAPDASHIFEAKGRTAILFIEPESLPVGPSRADFWANMGESRHAA